MVAEIDKTFATHAPDCPPPPQKGCIDMEQEYYCQTKWEQWPVHFTHVQSEYVSLSNDLLASENWAFILKWL